MNLKKLVFRKAHYTSTINNIAYRLLAALYSIVFYHKRPIFVPALTLLHSKWYLPLQMCWKLLFCHVLAIISQQPLLTGWVTEFNLYTKSKSGSNDICQGFLATYGKTG